MDIGVLNQGGDGGIGVESDISGTPTYYGGGGGGAAGGANSNGWATTNGVGGLGGGGNGRNSGAGSDEQSGVDGLGGGGGGKTGSGANGSDPDGLSWSKGGHGRLILRAPQGYKFLRNPNILYALGETEPDVSVVDGDVLITFYAGENTLWSYLATSVPARCLLVGGGAGGGRTNSDGRAPGGGGGGAVVDETFTFLPIGGSTPIRVGAGAPRTTSGTAANGQNGNDTIAFGYTALRGLRGRGTGTVVDSGAAGGTGGGYANRGTLTDPAPSTQFTDYGYGHAYRGGFAYGTGSNPENAGGGGGGAGTVGGDASSGKGGDGGDGVESDITGSSVYYGGGGGGALPRNNNQANNGANNGSGGLGGGGWGNHTTSTHTDGPLDGVDGLGGGGGARGGNAAAGGGGDGVAILRLTLPSGVTVRTGVL